MSLRIFLKECQFKLFLRSYHTESIPHERGNFYQHLWGTYKLLRGWGCSEQVCDAGLFHSIYGTRIFRRQTIPHSERGRVRRLIGAEAERLSYLFSVCDRPQAIIEAHKSMRLYDTLTGQYLEISEEIIQHLIEIECANLLEQRAGHSFLRWIYNGQAGCRNTNIINSLGLFLGNA